MATTVGKKNQPRLPLAAVMEAAAKGELHQFFERVGKKHYCLLCCSVCDDVDKHIKKAHDIQASNTICARCVSCVAPAEAGDEAHAAHYCGKNHQKTLDRQTKFAVCYTCGLIAPEHQAWAHEHTHVVRSCVPLVTAHDIEITDGKSAQSAQYAGTLRRRDRTAMGHSKDVRAGDVNDAERFAAFVLSNTNGDKANLINTRTGKKEPYLMANRVLCQGHAEIMLGNPIGVVPETVGVPKPEIEGRCYVCKQQRKYNILPIDEAKMTPTYCFGVINMQAMARAPTPLEDDLDTSFLKFED